MRAVGDKVILKKVDLPGDEGGIVLANSPTVLCRVLATGPGMPYGRGEFYELTVMEGDLVLIAEKAWREAPSMRLRPEPKARPEERKVVHEREILSVVTEEEL
jgi:co-chaperonin GroES (HSP10)